MTPAPDRRTTRRPSRRRPRLPRRTSARLRAARSGGAGFLAVIAVLAPTYVWLADEAGVLGVVTAWAESVVDPGASLGGRLPGVEDRVPAVAWGPGVALVAVLAVASQVWRTWTGTP